MKFHFPEIAPPSRAGHPIARGDWEDWRWQMRSALKSRDAFHDVFSLEADESHAFDATQFQFRCTPYYAEVVKHSPSLRRIVVPHSAELMPGAQQMDDPLGEKRNNPASRIIHRYPDRALFLVTDICSVYCRYCTRKHFTGQDQAFAKHNEYQEALDYIATHPGIREVILSGGDPLTLSDAQLKKVLHDLRAIDHVEIIRIGTRMPVVCPMRVTPELVQILREFHPIYIMTHFNHPHEITQEAATALLRFVDNGFPVFNQMVLLSGVNNHEAVVQALSRRLLFLRVKPYYMFQCDPSEGTDHLRTSIEDSLEIQRELWGRLSGLAMPTLSVDIPQGGGKAALVPDFEVARFDQVRVFRGWDGVEAPYINPAPEHVIKPDYEEFLAEWNLLKDAKHSTLTKRGSHTHVSTPGNAHSDHDQRGSTRSAPEDTCMST